MIRTRRSFLQRVKERNEKEKSSSKQAKKGGDLDWSRSKDDSDLFSDYAGDTALEKSTGSGDDLIVCPPVTARNPAQEAAEALRQDLEDMGYDLDCKSFITKGTMESDCVLDDRYQRPPRKLKPKTHSFVESSGSAQSSVATEKDFILSMRSLVSPGISSTAERPLSICETKTSTRKRDETSDWNSYCANDSNAEHSPGSSVGGNAEKSKTSGEKSSTFSLPGILDSNSSCVDSDVGRLGGRNRETSSEEANHADDVPSERASEPSVQTYGSLKKIVTVQAVASFNETTISSLRRRVAEKKCAIGKEKSASAQKNVEAEKNENMMSHSIDESSALSHLENADPVPETLTVPIRNISVTKSDAPKKPVMIEGMSFVKNTTQAPESTRNSTYSPRTRKTRIKLRRFIQEKLEHRQDTEITSAKTAPARPVTGFFSDAEMKKVDKPHQLRHQEIETREKGSVETHTDTKDGHTIECGNNAEETMVEKEDPDPKINDSDSSSGQVLEATKEVLLIRDASNDDANEDNPDTSSKEQFVETAIEKTNTNQPLTTSPTHKFRPFSLFRKASLSPQKKRKPEAAKPKENQVVPTSKENESKMNEESAFVGYDIETDDGVEVIAVAKTLPFVDTDVPAEIHRLSLPNLTHQSPSIGIAIAEERTKPHKDSSFQPNSGVSANYGEVERLESRCDTKATEEHESRKNETDIADGCSQILNAVPDLKSTAIGDEPGQLTRHVSKSEEKFKITKSSEKSNCKKEKQSKWKALRAGLRLRRKENRLREKASDQPRDRHEMIQNFLDRTLQGQEEHSFPSKLDPIKNPQSASFLQEMMTSQIPKQLIISKLDDSSCITTETEKKKEFGPESFISPSALDANVWDEIANAGVLVEKAIVQLEEASKKGDGPSTTGSSISREIEKAVLTLKKHSDRLGVTETELLLAVKDSAGPASLTKKAESTGSTISSVSTTQTAGIGQDIFQAFQSFFTYS